MWSMRLDVKYSGNILIGILSIDLTIVRLQRNETQTVPVLLSAWNERLARYCHQYISVSTSLKANIKKWLELFSKEKTEWGLLSEKVFYLSQLLVMKEPCRMCSSVFPIRSSSHTFKNKKLNISSKLNISNYSSLEMEIDAMAIWYDIDIKAF